MASEFIGGISHIITCIYSPLVTPIYCSIRIMYPRENVILHRKIYE